MIRLQVYQVLQDKGGYYIALSEGDWEVPPHHRYATYAEAEAKIAEWEAEDLAAKQESDAASRR